MGLRWMICKSCIFHKKAYTILPVAEGILKVMQDCFYHQQEELQGEAGWGVRAYCRV